MFWDSVLAGLKVLTYWEIYVAGLEYLGIFLIPLALVGFVMEKSEGATSGSAPLTREVGLVHVRVGRRRLVIHELSG